MSYAELYKYCQGLPVPISRRNVIPKVVELARRPRKPFIMLRTMNPAVLAGFIVFPSTDTDPNHPLLKFGKGEPVIVVSRSLNYCWQRFVILKEMMHYFDQSLERVTNPADFGSLLAEFAGPQPDRSLAMNSEVKALWMALGVMCPEELRQEFERQLAHGATNPGAIAERLKMPLAYVHMLFYPQYKQIIGELCAC